MKRISLLVGGIVPLLFAACATDYGRSESGYYDRGDYNRGSYADTQCRNCGVVERIERGYGDRRTSGGGAVAGAVIGGLVGNQIGSGDGRKVATVAGAVAGGIAGNNIERNRNSDGFAIYVRTDDGRAIIARQQDLNGVREGDRVVVRGSRVYLMR